MARAGHAAPNRDAFLADCLAALDSALRERGGRLVVRSGDPVAEVCAVVREADADEVHMAAGCSGFARRREDRLRRALEADGRRLYVHDAVVTALPTGAVTPGGSDHYAVFTPYFRRWSRERLREPLAAPRVVRTPRGIRSEDLPARANVQSVSGGLAAGGEQEGRKRLAAWLAEDVDTYEERHDDLAGTRRPASRRTSTSARSRRPRRSTGPGRAAGRAPRRSYGSSAGATSTTRSSPRAPTRPPTTTAPVMTAGGAGRRRRPTSGRGVRAAPVTRSWTPRCGNSPTRAGCTTGGGCSPPRS